MRIALAGNPNSGKTSIYNILTGKGEKVGNWAGVTVDKKEATLKRSLRQSWKGAEEVTITDLPGAYSISAFTSEESIAENYIKQEAPDVIINVVDATNLSRSLLFTGQLMDMGFPMVIALNKADINRKKGINTDIKLLSEKLGCPVVETEALTGKGIIELLETVANAAKAIIPEGSMAGSVAENTLSQELSQQERMEIAGRIADQVEHREEQEEKESLSDRIDSFLTGKITGIPVFAVVMFLVFWISQTTIGPWIADYLTAGIELFQEYVAGLLEGASPLLTALLIDGIIGGVGAVIGFLPLVMVMYFLLSLLEDCGYMARVSVVLDPIFKKVGLSGKSIIPFVVGTGCAIPGIMACRTIKDEQERRATAMLTPFMPCGAKLPVIALFAGVFFPGSSWVGPMMYFVGIILIWCGAWVVNKIAGAKGGTSFFLIELPDYKLPSIKAACKSMFSRAKAYIIKAGTVILVCNTVIQIMQSFTPSFRPVAEGAEDTSILAVIAGPVAFLLIPLGFGAWQMAAAAVTGFIAKENVVGTLAVCYGLTAFIDTEELALTGGAGEVAAVFGITKAAALACLMFNLYTPPCFAAIGAMNSEIKDRKWFFGGIGMQLATGYTLAFFVYQIGTVITAGHVGDGFLPGLLAVAVIIGIVICLAVKGGRNDR